MDTSISMFAGIIIASLGFSFAVSVAWSILFTKAHDRACEHNRALEARLGCPLEEEELISGEQYRREEPPEVIFVRRIRSSDSGSEPVRAIRACYLVEADALPVNAVFSVIQAPDGQRRVFVETNIDLPRATVKTN